MSRPILVTGIGGPAGRSLADQLISRGFDVLGVDLAPVSHAGARCERVPAAVDPAFLATLRRIAAHAGARLVIPTVAEEITVPGLGSPCDGPRVVVGPRPAVTVAADRWFTCRRLTAAGVPVPRHALPSHVPTPADVTAAVGRPFLSGPRRGRGARRTTVHDDPVTAGIELMDDTTILQEYAPGQEYTVNLYLARNPGHDLAVVLARTRPTGSHPGNAATARHLSTPAAATQTARRPSEPDADPLGVRRVSAPDVAEVAHRAARAIGLTGPAAVEVRRTADGTPLVLEINARFGPHSAHAHEVLDALLAEHLPVLDIPAAG